MRHVISDKRFHLALYCIIAALAFAAVHFKNEKVQPDPYQSALNTRISQFDRELAMQRQSETETPNAAQVPILIYHSVRPHTATQTAIQKYYDVAPEQFEKQLLYLKENGYIVIGLDFLATALEQNIILPPKSVVITLDDGWRNQYAYAFPLLRKYKDTATFFIFTSAIDHDLFLTWDQVRLMNNAGMSIGGHTKTHPYLGDIKDEATLRDEIIGGKRIIEGQIGQKITLFAYPYGHYSDQIINIVKEAGYKSARSTYKGITHTKAELYKLKGIEVTDDFDQFVANLDL